MNDHDETLHPRSVDGKYATKAVDESAPITLGDPAIPLAQAVPGGGMLTIGEDEFDGAYAFQEVDVTRNEDGTFRIAANAYSDVDYGLMRAWLVSIGKTPQDVDVETASEASEAFLVEYSEDAIAWFEHETGASIAREFEWDNQRFAWSTELPPGASTDEVIAAAETSSNTHPDEIDGFYRRMLAEAPGFRARTTASS